MSVVLKIVKLVNNYKLTIEVIILFRALKMSLVMTEHQSVNQSHTFEARSSKNIITAS